METLLDKIEAVIAGNGVRSFGYSLPDLLNFNNEELTVLCNYGLILDKDLHFIILNREQKQC